MSTPAENWSVYISSRHIVDHSPTATSTADFFHETAELFFQHPMINKPDTKQNVLHDDKKMNALLAFTFLSHHWIMKIFGTQQGIITLSKGTSYCLRCVSLISHATEQQT